MSDGILYSLNLNLSMCFRVGSRSHTKSKTKLSVRTVSNSSQLLPFFVKKSYILIRCCIGFELITATWSMKILQSIEREAHMCAVLGKYEKSSVYLMLRKSKNTFPEVLLIFHIHFAFRVRIRKIKYIHKNLL